MPTTVSWERISMKLISIVVITETPMIIKRFWRKSFLCVWKKPICWALTVIPILCWMKIWQRIPRRLWIFCIICGVILWKTQRRKLPNYKKWWIKKEKERSLPHGIGGIIPKNFVSKNIIWMRMRLSLTLAWNQCETVCIMLPINCTALPWPNWIMYLFTNRMWRCMRWKMPMALIWACFMPIIFPVPVNAEGHGWATSVNRQAMWGRLSIM